MLLSIYFQDAFAIKIKNVAYIISLKYYFFWDEEFKSRKGELFMSSKSLEQYLKELRKSYNYSQEFVASHLNITRQTYSHYETGRITPPSNSLYNIAKLYGIPVENLMEKVVTYNINDDFAKKTKPSENEDFLKDDLSSFLEYINAPENSKRFKSLHRSEKFFLYYYNQLDCRDQDDILTFMKVKYHNRKNEEKN